MILLIYVHLACFYKQLLPKIIFIFFFKTLILAYNNKNHTNDNNDTNNYNSNNDDNSNINNRH